jgi:anti-sigma-K factor RskA
VTGDPRTPDQRPCGGEVAAYALGALTPVEADEFRRHLESCAVCRDELAAFRDVVDQLPLSAPAHRAPATVRRRVMRQVNADARRRRAPNPDESAGASLRGQAARLRPRHLLGAGTVLAAAAIVAVVLSLGSGPPPANRVIDAQVAGHGTAQLRIVNNRASLVVRHFAAPPAGRIYEIWVKRGHRAPTPTGSLFSVTSAGNADIGVPASLTGASAVLVTPEPAGGSPAPTHAPVITVSLT